MELTFVESNALGKVKAWECEFEVTADFNLHIEREKGGRILFYQKSQGAGGWAHIDDMGWQDGKPSIDYDFTALVYPKMIKIVSESEPTFASVATDGEVTEIKSQSKEIEVTANGTTVVEPDAGFAYLNKVSVKTNVEGQGGGGSEGGANYKYFLIDTSNMSYLICTFSSLLKARKGDSIIIIPSAQQSTQGDIEMLSCRVNMDDRTYDGKKFVAMSETVNAIEAAYGKLTEITEEEFYTV